MESRVEQAVELFRSGYNCAQAVFATYSDLFGTEKELALKISSSFGGGLGGMREICGAISGMCLVVSLHNGYTLPNDKEAKKINYNTVQLMSDEFRNENGSIVCKHLLGLEPGLPLDKKKKPCAEYVRACATLIEKHLFHVRD